MNIDMTVHGHFKCEKCGKIYDLDVNKELLNSKELDEYKIKEHHLYFKGICKIAE